MIGLALVTLVATLARGIMQTFTGAVDEIFVGDYAITAQNNFSPIPIDAAEAAAKAPGVEAVAQRPHGRDARLRLDRVRRRRSTRARSQGDQARLERGLAGGLRRRSGNDGAFVDNGLRRRSTTSQVGSPVELTFAERQHRRRSWSRGSSTRRPAARRSASSRSRPRAWDAQNPTPEEHLLVRADGRRRDGREHGGARGSARSRSRTRRSRRGRSSSTTRSRGLKSILNILYVLLALSVIVSLFGIVNTLVLTRLRATRELGMLRAIGMTRRQVRRMIRHESVITALIGGALGIVLGIVLGGAADRARST